MLNSISIMGRLTRDPELRQTQSGKSVANFTIACSRDFGEKDNNEADFIDIVAWQKTGEFADTYFRKGQLVAVQGRIQSRKWTDKDGNKRTTVEIVANRLYFAESKKASPDAVLQSNSEGEPYDDDGSFSGYPDFEDDELPF